MKKTGGDMPRINIDCSPDGDFDYGSNEVCVARLGETIEWVCEGEGLYCLNFGWDTPFDRVSYEEERGKRISIRIPEDARLGRYKYTIAVSDDAQRRIFSDDPWIIIKGG
jgi:hypothetical protein